MCKKIVLLLVFVAFSCSKEDVFNGGIVSDLIIPLEKCVNGFAGIYPCNEYDLMAHIPLEELYGADTEGNDCWGWTDPLTQNEYALMGTTKGTSFIDITDPIKPIILGSLNTATENSIWRDIKVFNNFAFIVSEASNHGMQVFDLTRLRNVTSPPQIFEADTQYSAFGKAHNVVINETSGFAYAVGTNTYSGGPHFVDINNPLTPISAGGYADDGYSHDAQVVTYEGPDIDYTGKEILIGSNKNEIVIVDVTDKANPTQISKISYNNVGYAHQGWFTEDMTYFILGDELDEYSFGGNTRTVIFDFSDLDNPTFSFDYFGSTAAIDHNGYVKNKLLYQANYTAGVRIIDVSNIQNQTMTEVGFFDTYPENNDTAFHGVWSVYPFFESGNIIISDIERGFFIIKKSGS
jgi:choice-of-anchor B domain-containing protein